MSLDWSSNAGILPISTVGAPGTHGAGVTGTQGMGVNTPKAAAVAAATVGLEGELQTPKGGTLTIGLPSMMVAAGGPPARTWLAGKTSRLLGAAPKLHCNAAPAQTRLAMEYRLGTGLRDSGASARVQYTRPSHCAGQAAFSKFADKWGLRSTTIAA